MSAPKVEPTDSIPARHGHRRFPGFCVWLRGYRREWLSGDVIAGVTLAAYAVPVSLAYATLSGVPPAMGLYCYLVGGIGYAMFGTSRHLAIGPTSAISLLVGVSLVGISGGDPQVQGALASLTALATALMFAFAWLLRLSALVSFISESILTGFKIGAALVIATTQLPKLFGIRGGGDDFFERLTMIVSQLAATHLLTFAIGLIALGMLVAGERLLPGRPAALVVMFVALVAVAWGKLDDRGVRVVGQIPAGLPNFQATVFDFTALEKPQVRQIVRLAAACFLLSYIESVSAARTFALKHGYDVDSRHEMIGLGLASLLAAVWQGYPLAGGLSQSAVNERGGAKTPLSLVVASLVIGCVLLFLTGLFRNLPDAVLAAVVLVAVRGLMDFREYFHLWRVSRIDFIAATVALLGVLLMGVLDGVLVAVLASLVMVIVHAARPQIAFLGRIPGTDRFSDLARHPDNLRTPGVLVFRVQASLLYFNVDHVRETLRRAVQAESGLRRVVGDLSNVPYIDVAGARMLRRLSEELRRDGQELKLSDAHGPVRDVLRAEGLADLAGAHSRPESLAALVGPAPPGN